MSDLYIIAEAAQGYLPLVGDRGSVDTALLLVQAAAAAGADGVKFQIVFVDELAQPGNVHYDIFRRLEMSGDEWRRVREYARTRGIDFLADVFGPSSLDVAARVGADGIKIHSTSFFDHGLVHEVLQLGKPAFFSLGGIRIEELDAFIERHDLRARREVTLLYGFQKEPTPVEGNNLARIPALLAHTGLPVGFMDHSDGAGPDATTLSVAALALGVRVFEKHVTLDRELALEDYVSALPPGSLRGYVETLRRLAAAMGTADLTLTEAELAYREKALKRATAAGALAPGATIRPGDVLLIRPDQPRGAIDAERVVGRRLKRALAAGEPISLEDVE